MYEGPLCPGIADFQMTAIVITGLQEHLFQAESGGSVLSVVAGNQRARPVKC